MKNFINRFWWLFPALFAALVFTAPHIHTMPTIILWIIPIALLLSWIILLIYRKWWKCLVSFAIATIAFFLFCYMLTCAIDTIFNPRPDNFGKEHPIPAWLDYNLPHSEGEEPSCPIDSTATNTWLQIWNGFQGGIYMYDFHHPAIEEGEIFLRCYEATENIPLSPERISHASRVTVPSTKSFSKLVKGQSFIIYSGDCSDYYAARIEVWHKDAKTGKERKLMEKVYCVEGWQR